MMRESSVVGLQTSARTRIDHCGFSPRLIREDPRKSVAELNPRSRVRALAWDALTLFEKASPPRCARLGYKLRRVQSFAVVYERPAGPFPGFYFRRNTPCCL